MTQVAPRHLAALLVITLIWGLNLIVSKIGLTQVPPMLFTTLRFAVLAALLWPFLRVVPGKMNAMVVAALLSGALNFALLFAGLAIAQNVSAVAIASQLGIPFTTLLSVALLGETVRWRRWTGIALSFAGVMIIGLDPVVFGFWPSLVLVIASAMVGSLGVIAVKRLPEFKPLEVQAWFSWVSLPVLALLALVAHRPGLAELRAIPLQAWGAIAYTAILGSLIAHTGFYHLVQRYPVTSVAPLTTLSPVFSVIFGITLLGDAMTPRIAVGGLVTLTGVLIITLRERRLTDTGS
ncbi:MAG: DMT family transporter [Gammaproteobacteria bacterium]|nr:DMT family transporter [Gammaproteobacteria bacterium]